MADPTPQLQEAIGGGAGLFTVTGTDDFNISGYQRASPARLRWPDRHWGPRRRPCSTALTTIENLIGSGVQTDDPADPDVALINTIVETYTDIDPGATATPTASPPSSGSCER